MRNKFISKIHKTLAYTVLHKPLMELRTLVVRRLIYNTGPKLTPTVYVISPFKTGTTYLASLWNEKISRHEPFDLYSLKYMPNDFEINFSKRANCLNIKLECSGFLSLYIKKLPLSSGSNGIKYIYVLRKPTDWVKSVMTHFDGIKKLGYNYIDLFYWQKLLGYSMNEILLKNDKDASTILVNDIYKLYFKFLEEVYARDDVYFVELNQLDELAQKLGTDFGIAPNFNRSWQRKSESSFRTVETKNPAMDEKYKAFLSAIPSERFYLNA